jgi:hypothetical protein
MPDFGGRWRESIGIKSGYEFNRFNLDAVGHKLASKPDLSGRWRESIGIKPGHKSNGFNPNASGHRLVCGRSESDSGK